MNQYFKNFYEGLNPADYIDIPDKIRDFRFLLPLQITGQQHKKRNTAYSKTAQGTYDKHRNGINRHFIDPGSQKEMYPHNQHKGKAPDHIQRRVP